MTPQPIKVPGGYLHLMEITTAQERHGDVEVEFVFKGYFSKAGWEEFRRQQTPTCQHGTGYCCICNPPPSPRLT